MNAILGTVQTVKAEQSLDSLKAMSGPEAKVFRNGDVIKVPSSEVTIGDIVMLEAGDYVPADGRILENASLKVDEALEWIKQKKKSAVRMSLWETEPIWCIPEALFPTAEVLSW